MAAKLKLIKSKEFQANGNTYHMYTVAYKGRVMGINTMYWTEESDDIDEIIEVDNNVLTLKATAVIRKRDRIDELTGEKLPGAPYLDLMPKVDLEFSEI